jgi:predicted alpha/beta hydrolase
MEPNKLSVIVLPAMGIAAGYYGPLVEQLRQALSAEVSVLSLRVPQTWLERISGSVSYGYPELVQEICQRVTEQQARHPEQKVLLLGHSLGGQAAMVAATRLGPALAGIALVACGTPYWGAWPADQQQYLRKLIRAVDILTLLLPWYPGNLLGFGGHQPRRLMRQWCRFANTGSMASIEDLSADAANFARLSLPVLAINVLGDQLAPPSATDNLLEPFVMVRCERKTLDEERLRALPPARRHIAWIRQPAEVVRLVADWLGAAGLRPLSPLAPPEVRAGQPLEIQLN